MSRNPEELTTSQEELVESYTENLKKLETAIETVSSKRNIPISKKEYTHSDGLLGREGKVKTRTLSKSSIDPQLSTSHDKRTNSEPLEDQPVTLTHQEPPKKPTRSLPPIPINSSPSPHSHLYPIGLSQPLKSEPSRRYQPTLNKPDQQLLRTASRTIPGRIAAKTEASSSKFGFLPKSPRSENREKKFDVSVNFERLKAFKNSSNPNKKSKVRVKDSQPQMQNDTDSKIEEIFGRMSNPGTLSSLLKDSANLESTYLEQEEDNTGESKGFLCYLDTPTRSSVNVKDESDWANNSPDSQVINKYQSKIAALFDEVEEVVANNEKRLDLKEFPVNSTQCLEITQRLIKYKRLKELVINSICLGPSGAASLASVLESTSLESLKVKYWPIDESVEEKLEIGAAGLKHISRSLSSNVGLTSLDLSNNNLTDPTLLPLITVLSSSISLLSLNLSGNPITNTLMVPLKFCFKRNCSIQHFKLKGTKITTEGAMKFFDCLLINRTLKILEIRTKNLFSQKQLTSIAELVHYSATLNKLKIICGTSALPESTRKIIDQYLKANIEYDQSNVNTIYAVNSSVYGEMKRLKVSHQSNNEYDWETPIESQSLSELIAQGTSLSCIPTQVCALQNLRILHLQNNQIPAIPDVIEELPSLTVLNLSHNQIEVLPNLITRLSKLKVLIINNNQINKITGEISMLTKLKILDLSCNLLTVLPEIVIRSLKYMLLNNNLITTLPTSIGNMSELKSLHLCNNKLEFLPLQMCKLKKLEILDLEGNTLSTIPREIKQGPISSIFAYLNELERGSEMFASVKIMVLGPEGSGKTSLIDSMFQRDTLAGALQVFKGKRKNRSISELPNQCKITIRDWSKDSYSYKIWEFTGDDSIICTTHQFFVTPNSVYIITFKADDHSSIDNWIQSIASKVTNCPVIIVGTFAEEKSAAKGYYSEVLYSLDNKYKERFPNIAAYIVVSNKTKKGINDLKQNLQQIIVRSGMIKQRLPSSYFLLMRKLEFQKDQIRFSLKPPILTWSEFVTLANSFSVKEENVQELAQYLHKTGTISYFEGEKSSLLRDIIFLDPDWLTDVFSSVFYCKDDLINDGKILHDDLNKIWKEPKFPQKLRPVLLALLQKFDILFPLPTRNNNPHEEASLIPSLLPPERPPIVKDIWPTFEDNLKNLSRIWEFKFLPPGFFPRLIARTCYLPLISVHSAWRTGMVVRQGTMNKALVEYNPSLFKLILKIRLGEANNFVNLLFDNINSFIEGWYKNQLTSILLPCVHCLYEHSFDPFMFSLSDCELYAARGKRYAHCRGIRPVRIDLIAPDVALADAEHLLRSDIELGTQLGEGSFAIVYRGKLKEEEVAIKVIKMQNDNDDNMDTDEILRNRFAEFRREVSLMSGLDHQNLVELKGLCLEANSMFMVTEFLAYGDLYNFLHNETVDIQWPLRLKIAIDVARGMNFLHTTTPPIIHRDLKSPNILLASNNERARVVAKVADFGLSSTLVQTASGRDVFNPIWLAPEVMVRGAEYTEKADVYSFGIILWELITRETPFAEFDSRFPFSSQLENEIITNHLRPTIPPSTPALYRDLIESCWKGEASHRPTFGEIIDVLKEQIAPAFAPNMLNNQSFAELNRIKQTSVGRTNSIDKDNIQLIDSNANVECSETMVMSSTMNFSIDPLLPSHKGSVKCMTVADDHVWVGCGDGRIYVWSTMVSFIFLFATFFFKIIYNFFSIFFWFKNLFTIFMIIIIEKNRRNN